MLVMPNQFSSVKRSVKFIPKGGQVSVGDIMSHNYGTRMTAHYAALNNSWFSNLKNHTGRLHILSDAVDDPIRHRRLLIDVSIIAFIQTIQGTRHE